MSFLDQRTRSVRRKRSLATKKAQAETLWKSRAKAFLPVRTMLRETMAPPGRCMYCEHSEGTAVDHFWPLASYPERAFVWENLLWACSHCNSNDKRDQFPLDSKGDPLLIDPTHEDPADHLDLHPSTGRFKPRTNKGTESIRVFGLGRPFLETGRKDAWISVLAHLEAYANAVARGDIAASDAIRGALIRAPHGSVLRHLLALSKTAVALHHIPGTCIVALAKHPEVFGWV